MPLRQPSDSVILDLPAPSHSIWAPAVAESLVGQEFDLDERIAGMTGLIIQSLSADHRGLWTRARITAAQVTDDGTAVRVVIEGA